MYYPAQYSSAPVFQPSPYAYAPWEASTPLFQPSGFNWELPSADGTVPLGSLLFQTLDRIPDRRLPHISYQDSTWTNQPITEGVPEADVWALNINRGNMSPEHMEALLTVVRQLRQRGVITLLQEFTLDRRALEEIHQGKDYDRVLKVLQALAAMSCIESNAICVNHWGVALSGLVTILPSRCRYSRLVCGPRDYEMRSPSLGVRFSNPLLVTVGGRDLVLINVHLPGNGSRGDANPHWHYLSHRVLGPLTEDPLVHGLSLEASILVVGDYNRHAPCLEADLAETGSLSGWGLAMTGSDHHLTCGTQSLDNLLYHGAIRVSYQAWDGLTYGRGTDHSAISYRLHDRPSVT